MTETHHLQPTMSARGFAAMPPISGTFGEEVQVYESSAARGPHLWLKATAAGREAVLHLTAAGAWQVVERLDALFDSEDAGPFQPVPGVYGGEVRLWQTYVSGRRAVYLHAVEGGDGAVVDLAPGDARKLRQQIDCLLANHYQGDARPEGVPDAG